MISIIAKIYKTLTWKRVALYIVASAIAVTGYTVFEYRERVFSPLLDGKAQNSGTIFTISKRTEQQLIDAVTAAPTIVGAAVFSADLRSNIAELVFFTNTKINLSAKKIPIFSSHEDSNFAAIMLINGEFSCAPFKIFPISSLAPELSDVKYICRISIPSYYGYFSGYISIFLSAEPDQIQQQQIKLVFSSLSTSIYFKDVLPTQRTAAGRRLP